MNSSYMFVIYVNGSNIPILRISLIASIKEENPHEWMFYRYENDDEKVIHEESMDNDLVDIANSMIDEIIKKFENNFMLWKEGEEKPGIGFNRN